MRSVVGDGDSLILTVSINGASHGIDTYFRLVACGQRRLREGKSGSSNIFPPRPPGSTDIHQTIHSNRIHCGRLVLSKFVEQKNM